MSFLRVYFSLFFLSLICFAHSQRNYFPYNVASGDPTPNSIILWTCFNPVDTLQSKYEISWEISDSKKFYSVIDSGITLAQKHNHYTLKVDVSQLQPNKWYYYRFKYKNFFSATGRTKTASNNKNTPVNFAVVSCSNYEHGYFNVYQNILNQNNVDAVIHLGDYIYEFGSGYYSSNMLDRKTFPFHEVITLQDYRARYAHYRKDTSLQKLHQNFPFINIWDDHEIANNAYKDGAQNHLDSIEGNYKTRLNAAKKAFYEWLPIRENTQHKLYRKFNYSPFLNLVFLDTRIEERDKQSEKRRKKFTNDTSKRIIGNTQFKWLTNQLQSDTNTWNIIAQQVMFAPFKVAGITANTDQWDGYMFGKQKLLNYIHQNNLQNIVFLTGDLHSAWANHIPDKQNKHKSIGVEFITPSITSICGIPINKTIIKLFNSHAKYVNLKQHGHLFISVTNRKLITSFNFVSTVLKPNFSTIQGPVYQVIKNKPKLLKQRHYSLPISTNPPIINY